MSADGTLICPAVLGSTGTNPIGAAGGIQRRESEIILKQNEQYLIKFTPYNDDAKVSLCVDFYEIAAPAADGS